MIQPLQQCVQGVCKLPSMLEEAVGCIGPNPVATYNADTEGHSGLVAMYKSPRRSKWKKSVGWEWSLPSKAEDTCPNTRRRYG